MRYTLPSRRNPLPRMRYADSDPTPGAMSVQALNPRPKPTPRQEFDTAAEIARRQPGAWKSREHIFEMAEKAAAWK
jgi:hypothetical protein